MSKDIKKSGKYMLYIDTSKRENTIVTLHTDGKKCTKEKRLDTYTSQWLLPLIEEILKEQKLTFQNLTAIEVATGPGSYTGLRVGAAVANTLGWMLNIPVNGKKGKIVEPVYE